jgi:hypothetical protein
MPDTQPTSDLAPTIETGETCPSCLRAFFADKIRGEAVQPLPAHAGPLDNEGKPWCHDCATAELLRRIGNVPTWDMARTAVGNDRQEQYRLPGAPIGLVGRGLMKPNVHGDLARHYEWLRTAGLLQ